jgi:predicted MFS family arabinose efflux permease
MTASARLQFASIFAAYAAAGIYWGALVASLPAFEAMSGLSSGGFGLLLTAQTLGGIVAMQALGRVLHRVQAWAIPACFALFALGALILAAAQGPWLLGLAIFWAGGASGALDIALNMRVARIEAETGARLFNRVHAVFPFAMLVSSAATGLLREAGATPAMLLPPIAAVFLIAAYAERRAGGHQRPEPAREGGGKARFGAVLFVLAALAAMGALMEGGGHAWAAIYLEHELKAGAAMAGFASAAITLGFTVGRLIAHRLETRLRDMAILRLSALFALPAFLLLAFAPWPWAALLGYFLAGVGIGPVEPAVFRSVAKRYPEAERGRALALATGLAYLGYLSAPPVFGQVIEGAGWGEVFLCLGAVALCASALTLAVPPARE